METNIHYSSVPYDIIYRKMWEESHKGAYVSYLRGSRCQTDESFFTEISASFQFPGYFGNNWNALHDCLSDLGWLNFSKIFIAIDDFNIIYTNDDEGKRLLLKALNVMVENWKAQNIEVEVWLNDQYRLSEYHAQHTWHTDEDGRIVGDSIRGISCSLYHSDIIDLLSLFEDSSYDRFAPWCHKIDEAHPTIPGPYRDLSVTPELLEAWKSQSIWELILHIFPAGALRDKICSYEDFCRSSCLCCLIYYDCGLLDVYAKEAETLNLIHNKLVFMGAEDITWITDANDPRTLLTL